MTRLSFADIDNGIKANNAISPEDIFLETNNLLKHFGVPEEDAVQKDFYKIQKRASLEKINSRIQFFDINNRFNDFFSIVHTPTGETQFQSFQDKDSKKKIDYIVALSSGRNNVSINDSFHKRLLKATINAQEKPLSGLRIALDPGHMGGDYWDHETGKFVRDEKGNQLSEGLMVLQVALKLEEQLKSLGAEVFITRRDLAPVSKLPYKSFDLRSYQLKFLRESSLDDWFQAILMENHHEISEIYNAFLASNDFKKIFDESMRWRYFMLEEDLEARVKAINAFSPDITLIIHMDTDDSAGEPKGTNFNIHDGTKAYVVGGFNKNEFASREDRKWFGQHLLDTQAWDASVKLSRFIVDNIHSQMKIPFDSSSEESSIPVEPGIRARNLYIPRKLNPHATSYVECLYYSNPNEFKDLMQADYTMSIDGQTYSYSKRLLQIVNSLKDGVVDFVKNYH